MDALILPDPEPAETSDVVFREPAPRADRTRREAAKDWYTAYCKRPKYTKVYVVDAATLAPIFDPGTDDVIGAFEKMREMNVDYTLVVTDSGLTLGFRQPGNMSRSATIESAMDRWAALCESRSIVGLP